MFTEAQHSSCRRAACRLGILCFVVALIAACATRVPPPMPTTLAYPEFPYPQVPASLATSPGASRIDVGWRYLQVNDLKNADLEFGVALELGPRLYPARTGQGLVALAMRDYSRALTAFDAVLEAEASYVPALVGRGQTLLATERTDQALAAFEKALSLDPSLTDLSRRVEVLRFRNVQDVIDAAQAAARQGRLDEARIAYERALATSPDSAFLHRELGQVERRAGNADRALEHLRRATEPFWISIFGSRVAHHDVSRAEFHRCMIHFAVGARVSLTCFLEAECFRKPIECGGNILV